MQDKQWLKNLFIIFLSQIVFTSLLALFFYYAKGKIAGISAVLGGLVYCVPALLSGLFMSRASDTSATLVLAKVYLGTIYKMVVTICLFIYVFENMSISIWIFFTAYLATFVTQYIMSCVLYRRN